MTEDTSKKEDTGPSPSPSRLRLPEPGAESKSDRSWTLLAIFAVVAILVVALFSNTKG